MIVKGVVFSVLLWIGTFIYCYFVNPNILLVKVIDIYWFEFLGVMFLSLIVELYQIWRANR